MASPHKPERGTIVIAATFTAEPLLPALQFVLDQAGLSLDVKFAPYHQVFQELLSSTSPSAMNADGVDVVLVRLEDFVRGVEKLDEAINTIRRTGAELARALVKHAQHAKVPTLLAVMPPSPDLPEMLSAEIEAANEVLVADALLLNGTTLLSAADLELVSAAEHYDSVTDELAHLPFTEERYASIALAIARKVHALRVPARKVLVLDCDETLWRGVLGEDGVDGITITPGQACLQQFAVEMQENGILVCLASKNAERDVLDLFKQRTDMTLKLEHVVAHRINWDPKPRNIVSLARTLNLGLDAFVFVDDNPVECGLMRAELPEVVTLQLPADDEIESFLSHLWAFDKIATTDEDARRTTMYRENAARLELQEASADITQFVESLGLIIDIAAPEESEWVRAAQLTQRTNQFNFTGVRRTEAELRELARNGSTVLRVKVQDRFGDYGLVGLVIVDERVDALGVDTLLLSCRVLGRGVEHAILRRLGEIAKERRFDRVDVRFAPTAKNAPAHAFAESVAGDYRSEERGWTVYRIPVEQASAIVHTPGQDPAVMTEASESEAKKDTVTSTSPDSAGYSERYAKLAQTFVSGRSVLKTLRASDVRLRPLPGEPVVPDTYVERELLSLWQELLGLDGLGVEDDYFALGGTSLTAAKLIAEIWRRFGVKLPLTVILEAPTVRALSRQLQHQSNPRSEALVELKSGGPRNLFLVHDGNGETLLYLNLARRMPEDLAVIGIEPRRIAGVPLAHTTIEEMAAFYIEQLRKKQPQGPYLLGGMCAGGVIVYEMASQLVRAGESVELVAILDAARPHAAMKPLMTTNRLGRLKQAVTDAQAAGRGPLERARFGVRTIAHKVFSASRWKLLNGWNRLSAWSVRARFRLLAELLSRDLAWPKLLPELSTLDIYNSAEARYLPKPLSISLIVLARAQRGTGNDTPCRDIYADETFGWAAIANPLTVVDVQGGHSSMLQDRFVDSLAGALLPYLQSKVATILPAQFELHVDTTRSAITRSASSQPGAPHRDTKAETVRYSSGIGDAEK